tara:strand:- start:4518 stop:6119 length:1602 start_codon:yes stop_codon:yes gene_type:complete
MATFSRFLTAATLAAAFAAPAHAESDPQPGLAEFFSVNRIGTFVANTAIAALRTQMELEYDFLSTDLMRGSVSISGVVARPLLPYDQARQCVVTIDRAVLNTDVANPFQVASEMNLNLIGARANTACLPPEAAMAMRAAGMREIELDQFKIRAAYVYATGETSTDASLVINDFAAIDFSASGMILPRIGQFGPGDPAFRVMRAVASLKDMGGWTKVSAVLPPNFSDPETIKVIGTEAVTQFMSNDGLRAVTAVERNFVTQLMARVEDFVTDPGEITVEANLPATGIVIEPELYDSEPQALIAALALEARATPLSRTRILSGADLAALSDPTDLDAPRLLELGAALLDGDGVPKTPALVPGLLSRLMDDPDNAAQAAALIARAVKGQKPGEAYPYALTAAAGGIVGAVSLLDQLEQQMTTVEVLRAQRDHPQVTTAPLGAIDANDDPRQLRRLALSHYTGSGTVRSYAQSYYFALLAEAAGDIGATALRQEIEGRFAARGDDVRAAWETLSAEVQEQALADWIDGGLADRYQTR